eukprot:tig00020961_g16687.t1
MMMDADGRIGRAQAFSSSSEASEDVVIEAEISGRVPPPHIPRTGPPIFGIVLDDQLHGTMRVDDSQDEIEEFEEIQPAARSEAREARVENPPAGPDSDIVELESLLNRFRADLTSVFVKSRGNFRAEAEARILDERRRLDAQNERREAQLSDLQTTCRIRDFALDTARETIERMSDLLCKTQQRRLAVAQLGRIFTAWRQFRKDSKRMRFMQRKADLQFVRQAFRGWVRETRAGRRRALESYWEGRVEATASELIGKYEGALGEAREALEETRRQLGEEVAARQHVAAQVKQAFMRGIVALNLEALEVVRGDVPVPPPGSEPEGAMPYTSGIAQAMQNLVAAPDPLQAAAEQAPTNTVAAMPPPACAVPSWSRGFSLPTRPAPPRVRVEPSAPARSARGAPAPGPAAARPASPARACPPHVGPAFGSQSSRFGSR